MNQIGNKIDVLIRELRIDRTEFAERLGMTPNAISNWRKRELGTNVIKKIVMAFPQVRKEWLMDGTGEVLNTTDKESDAVRIRIKNLADLSGLTTSDFAQKVGIDASDFEKKLSGESEISDEDLMSISKALNVRLGWLLTGSGQVGLLSDELRMRTAIDVYRAQMNKEHDEEQKGIPLIPVHAMAGALSGDSTTVHEWDVEDWYTIPAFRKSDFCIRIEGDSMQPRYCRGDIIACTRVPLTDLWFQWHKVYVLDTRQGALVKHIEKGSDDDHIMLVSDNPDYKPFEIPTSEIFGVAIVNGLIRVE